MFSTDFSLVNTGVKRLSYILSLLLFILTVQIGSSQESITCNGKLQVSLDGMCSAKITAAMMLKGEEPSTFSEDNYTVTIKGLPNDSVFAIGTYEVTVTRDSDGNSCWGTIYVEDKAGPIVENCLCPPGNTDDECEFACTDEAGILDGSIAVPSPVATDCNAFTRDSVDVVTKADDCGRKTITRTWRFTDIHGFSSTCVQEFRLEPVDIADVETPLPRVILGCDNDLSMDAIYRAMRARVDTVMPTMALADTVAYRDSMAYRYAYPTVNGLPLREGVQCNIAVSKTDVPFEVCDQECSKSKKVVRTWRIFDWCSKSEATFVQILKAVDTIAPTIIAKDFNASTDPWKCTGTFYFPTPEVLTDNCTDVQYLNYSVHAQNGAKITWDASKKRWKATDAPKGTHEYYYVGEDCCGNLGRDTIEVTIEDNVPPVPVAKEYITVTLTTGGIAKIKPESVDNGSHDICGPVHLEIRRDSDNCNVTGNTTYNNDNHSHDSVSDTDDGQFVKLCCEDVTALENDVNGDGVKDAGYIKVWLRVWDDGDMDGTYGTAGDNYNETWAYVKVENKILPKIECPDDIMIECDADEHDTTLTGVPTIYGICGNLEPKYTDTEQKDKCETTITRKWYVDGYPDAYCEQIIMKSYKDKFNENDITWPEAHRVTNCADTDDGKVPTWNAPRCAQVGYSLKSDTFVVEADACLKIINRWSVIDWCQYSIDDYGYETGIWRHTSIIKVIDDEKPEITCKDEMFDVNDHSDVDNDNIVCERKNVMLTATATDNGDCPSVWIKWTVLVDLYGDGKYDYEYTYGTNKANNSFGTDANNNGIPDVYLAPTRSSGQAKITLPEDIPGSMQTHKVKWVASDGCGNEDVCNSTFMVVDKKAPTPYCIHISSALMQNGQVELWAKDFDKGSFDNCTSKENLRFTFTSTIPSQDSSFDPNERSSAKTFTCEDLKDGSPIEVTVYVWDEKDLHDFCSVELTLLDNQGACSGNSTTGADISGVVADPKGNVMKDVEIRLQSSIPDYSRSTKTNAKGEYAFSVRKDLDYKISGHKNDDVLRGVNTLDLVLIQRHILELVTLDDPYQVAAADINNDKKIGATDLLALRKVILDINDAFPNGQQSYIVVDADATMNDALNPWPLTTDVNIQNLSKDKTSKNLTIIKVGDINRDAPQLDGEVSTTRSRTTLPLETEVNSDNVQLFAARSASVAGLQLAIDLRGAELLEVTSDVLAITPEMYTVKGGKLYLSIANATNVDVAEGEELLKLITNNATTVGIANGTLASQAYIGKALETAEITISSRSQEAFALGQNKPNPFKEATTISYTLPTDGMVSLRVYDLSGRIVLNQNVPSKKGYNTHSINMKSETSGVYYYTLQSGEFTATRKMIIIE